MLHVDRQGGTWRLLGSVVYIHRQVSGLCANKYSVVAFSSCQALCCLFPTVQFETNETRCVVAGADHDAVHRVFRPHLLFLLRLPGGEGRDRRERTHGLHELRRRAVVGCGQYPRSSLTPLNTQRTNRQAQNPNVFSTCVCFVRQGSFWSNNGERLFLPCRPVVPSHINSAGIVSDHGDHDRVRGHGAADVDGQNRRVLLLSLRYFILRTSGSEQTDQASNSNPNLQFKSVIAHESR